MNEDMNRKKAQEMKKIIDELEMKNKLLDIDAQWDAYLSWCRDQENSTHE